LTTVKIGKFRPLPEPIRLQDLVHLARSRAEKKIRAVLCQSAAMFPDDERIPL